MKKLFAMVVVLFVCMSHVNAQKELDRFFFKNFQTTDVYYNDGRHFQIEANYDLIKGSFVFIDTYENNMLKLFGEQEKISAIKIGNRTFLPSRFGPTEIVQDEPRFAVYYKPHLLDKGRDSGYGTTSHASATRTYSHWTSYSGSTNYLVKENTYVNKINKIYVIELNGKEKQFDSFKRFLKLYSKQKKELQAYITLHSVDYNSPMQVLELYKYAESIVK